MYRTVLEIIRNLLKNPINNFVSETHLWIEFFEVFFQKIRGLLILRWRYLHHSNFFDLHFSKYALQRALICTILCFWLDKSALLGFEPGTLLVGRRVEGLCVLVIVKIGLGVALTAGPNLLSSCLWRILKVRWNYQLNYSDFHLILLRITLVQCTAVLPNWE